MKRPRTIRSPTRWVTLRGESAQCPNDRTWLLRPGAFSGPVRVEDGARGWLYFSFVTLTTVGYGDVLPVHPVARSLAMLEAVTGPLYLTILLARLVSLGVTPGPGREPG